MLIAAGNLQSGRTRLQLELAPRSTIMNKVCERYAGSEPLSKYKGSLYIMLAVPYITSQPIESHVGPTIERR